jgi:RNA polymerase sigma factor (TIGR02999 family)
MSSQRGTGVSGSWSAIYQVLREIAKRQLQQVPAENMLQTTALVHEAYLKLHGRPLGDELRWADEEHFFRTAALAMQQVLIDHHRSRKREKRGGSRKQVPLKSVELAVDEVEIPDHLPELISALDQLQRLEPTAAELVRLRYFTGMTNRQAAATLGISPRTADRYWSFARAWLYEALTRTGKGF